LRIAALSSILIVACPGMPTNRRQHTVQNQRVNVHNGLDNAAIGLALCTVSWRYRRRQECRLNTGPTDMT
jgi:hypothetical protein